ncbi:variable surface protein [Plasmodium gonderi]|uniref:Variable surface protein n=1 Tax=Plasmodium gonderi TaxID=77519 RepID=A0A1Y1JN17_PLAGO|nr:variable surface protein [Plasmodium gonderi]GAW83986.1 variable surface protein [Plasmodium gonderi]
MTIASSVNSQYNFKDMFPKCTEAFNSLTDETKLKSGFDKFMQPCIKFTTSVIKDRATVNKILFDCISLYIYLQHIEQNEKEEVNKIASCNYLYYQIKIFTENYRYECASTREFLKRMKDADIRKTIDYNICDIRKDDFKEIDEDLHLTLSYLDKVSGVSYHAKNGKLSCHLINAFEEYLKLLDKSKSKYNTSFVEVLKFFNDKYKTHIGKLPNCASANVELKHSTKSGTDIQVSVARNKEMTEEIITAMSAGCTQGMRTGFVLLCFSIIIIIIFILYKYTRCSSFVQPSIMKLKRMFMKNENKDYRDTMDSFEKFYQDSTISRRPISYIPKDYK